MVKSSGYLELTGGLFGKSQVSLSNQERNSPSVMANESHTGDPISESNQEKGILLAIPDRSVPASEYDQETYVVAVRPEKGLDKLPLRRNPDSGVHAAPHSDKGATFSKVPEKPTVDGFNWRKYGQKFVKGNKFTRSYYKCTYANCPARKQVEHSHDGNITEINYLWKHEHSKPPDNQARESKGPSLTSEKSPNSEASEAHMLSMVISSENLVEVAVSECSEMKNTVNNSAPDTKRRKKESASVNDDVVTKTNFEPRVVVETTSALDVVNDGYRWRKYGQKLVKGNPNPRSYYRCSNVGCQVKKHVERACHDERVVVTTYEGRHDHDMPAGIRTVTLNTQGSNNGTTTSSSSSSSSSDDDDELGSQPEANESTGTEMVVHVGA